jgi:O-antigen biosynthesis protein
MKDFFLSIVRRAIKFKINPVRDLVSTGLMRFEWTSTGENPAFDLEPQDRRDFIPSGWVYIESKMMRRGVDLVARLYVDIGSGFSDAEFFVIPATRSGHIKHVIKMPLNACGLRLEPMRGEGSIRLEFVRITKVSGVEKYIRMVDRVVGDIVKFRNTSQAKKYGVTWRRLLGDLEGAYAACANLRFHSAPMEYASYIQNFDNLRQSDIDAIEQHVVSFTRHPLISILIPVGNSSVQCLKLSVQSVLNQAYQNWELCIAVGNSDDIDVTSYIESLVSEGERIKIIFQEDNGQTSVASNNALELASGEFFAVISSGDLLSRYALYFVALKINQLTDVNVIYSDEDKTDDRAVRFDARFKSGWNPDLFFSHNMISRLAVYRTALLCDVGRFRAEFEGGHDYDLALRYIKNCEPSQISHIPRVLYHGRQDVQSISANSGSGKHAYAAEQRALSDFFKDKLGVTVSSGNLDGTYRVQYPLPTPAPKVTIIIPTRDGYLLLKKCIHSIFHCTDYENIEIIVVDNQSEDKETLDYLNSLSEGQEVRVIKYDFPFNYSSINNFAVKHASGDVLCFLNDDVEAFEPGWLREMVSHSLRPDIGVVGAKLLYSDNFIQHAGVVMGIGGFASHAHRLYPATHPGYGGRAVLTQNFSAVTGACLVMRRDLFNSLGGFDEKNLPVAFNDVDLCLRVREAGYRIVWTPYAVLYHYESYSRGDDQMSSEKRARFAKEKEFMISRWNTNNLNDEYYNQNLTLDREDFTLAHFPIMYKPWES